MVVFVANWGRFRIPVAMAPIIPSARASKIFCSVRCADFIPPSAPKNSEPAGRSVKSVVINFLEASASAMLNQYAMR
jgi:hypothetical protein